MANENPWLQIPLGDYEGHMSAEGVGQLPVLADLFEQVLEELRPDSIAVLGVAGGNGFDRVERFGVARILGVDCNREYLDAVTARFGHLAGLELHACDLSQQKLDAAPVDLVHAALVFEHAGAGKCLDNAIRMVRPGGCLSVVLQLPSESAHGVSPTPFPSIQRLRDHFRMIEPEWFQNAMQEHGFRQRREARIPLPAGKAFWLGVFERLC